jgi:fructuronate reductase
MRLSNNTLAGAASRGVLRPQYARSALQPGIVHLGLGAFHRAHQAVYTDSVIAAGDLRWGIVGVSLRSPDTRDALVPQDHLYTVAVRDAHGEELRLIGALVGSLVAPENPQAVLDAMADPRCHIVSLTVTEKGYCHDPASGALNLQHPDIVHDLAHPQAPRSAIGFIVRALALRRAAGSDAFTVQSCDNLPSNGDTTRGLLLAFAQQVDTQLARWIAEYSAFPNSMVDRIVPKTTDEDRAHVTEHLGAEDAWPVMTERFTQWVVEDRFAGPRPRWEDAGATMVRDAKPYEHAKLRMLNGSHSTLAYLGVLLGYETVDEAMADATLSGFIDAMMAEEIEPTLERPGLPAYRAELLERFRNPSLRHKLQQIAMDGSQKLPQRLLGTIRARLADDAPCERLCFAVAGWLHYLGSRNEIASDPLAAELRAAASIADTSAALAAALRIEAVFGSDLPADRRFTSNIARHLTALRAHGTVAAMRKLAVSTSA